MNMDILLPLVPKLWKSRPIPQLPLYAFTVFLITTSLIFIHYSLLLMKLLVAKKGGGGIKLLCNTGKLGDFGMKKQWTKIKLMKLLKENIHSSKPILINFITVKFHICMYMGSDISYETRGGNNDTLLSGNSSQYSIQPLTGLSSLITLFFFSEKWTKHMPFFQELWTSPTLNFHVTATQWSFFVTWSECSVR